MRYIDKLDRGSQYLFLEGANTKLAVCSPVHTRRILNVFFFYLFENFTCRFSITKGEQREAFC